MMSTTMKNAPRKSGDSSVISLNGTRKLRVRRIGCPKGEGKINCNTDFYPSGSIALSIWEKVAVIGSVSDLFRCSNLFSKFKIVSQQFYLFLGQIA